MRDRIRTRSRHSAISLVVRHLVESEHWHRGPSSERPDIVVRLDADGWVSRLVDAVQAEDSISSSWISRLQVAGMVPGRSASFANWYPGVRAIVASGYSNAPVFSDPESFGFSGVLPKPLMLGELERVVSEVLAMDSPSESSDRPDHASRSRR